MKSIHDNHVLSYCVDAQNEEIVLRTAFPESDGEERTDIVFTGVTAYHFERDNLATILFDIRETSIDAIYGDYEELFESRRNYGWPAMGSNSKEELLAEMHGQQIKGFVMSSSVGMCGWIWAKSMTKIAR